MKMVKSLLGAAAGLVAMSGAQAADLPVKAKPVEYVKVCSLYGAAYYYVPGTNTCLKLGFYVRFAVASESSGAQRPHRSGGAGRYTRVDTPGYALRAEATSTWDLRTQTEYGTLRVYANPGVENTSGEDVVVWTRAFIQLAGFTLGRATSAIDLLSFSTFSIASTDIGNSISASGIYTIRYTAELGNGLSATFGVEDGGWDARGSVSGMGRGHTVVDLGSTGVLGATGGFTYDAGASPWPDFVANLRLDQAWGTFQVAGTLHHVRGGFYQADGTAACTASPGTTACAAPSDKWGWSANVGLILRNVFGLKGDTFGAQFWYGEGATGSTHAAGNRAWAMWDDDTTLGWGAGSDAVFASPNTLVAGYDGSLQLTKSWAWLAGYDHVWSPQWRTSIYGGYGRTDYNATAEALICARVVASGFSTGTATCGAGPDYGVFQAGTRTKWSPVSNLDLSLALGYWKLDTAFENGTWTSGAQGGRPAGTRTFTDVEKWIAMFRAEYSFYD